MHHQRGVLYCQSPGGTGSRPVFLPRNSLWLLVLIAGLLLSGCITLSDPETSQEHRADVVARITPDQVVGQTFVPRRQRLNRVTLWLRVEAGAQIPKDALVAELYDSHLPTSPLDSVTVPLSSLATQEVNIRFQPQTGYPGKTYFLALKLKSGAIEVLGRNEDSYPDGQVYINQQPLNADASFRLGYDYNLAAMLGDMVSYLGQIPLGIALVFTLWLPGRLLLVLFKPDRRLDWGERTALSVGMSLAVIPVVFTWTTVLKLHWNRAGVWIVVILLWGALLWRLRPLVYRMLETRPRGSLGILRAEFLKWPPLKVDAASLALGAVFLAALAVRLAMARDLSAPPWVDSVHHAMIIRLILEKGQFSGNFYPFVEISASNYHAGFHSAAAVFQWLSGTDLARGLLLFGQVMNALAVLAVYLFTTTFTRSRWAGVFAAFITGLLTPMPAYYTSWGRYTQLAGLLVLPAAFFWLRALYEGQAGEEPAEAARAWWQPLVLAGIAAAISSAGLFLIHFRVAAFLVLLVIVDWVAVQLTRLRQPGLRRAALQQAAWVLGAALLAGLLVLPWLPGIVSNLVLPRLGGGVGAKPFSDFSWGYLTSAYGRWALYLAGGGATLAILQRWKFPVVLAAWIASLFLVANLGALGLPGGGFVNNTSAEISLFMPLSAAGGYLLGWLLQLWPASWPGRGRIAYFAGWVVAAVVVAVLGARALLTLLNPVTMLFREPDRTAIQWIDANLPKDARILINPFSWGYGIYAGQDGGAWIVPLALRETFPPPVLYGLTNDDARASQISRTVRSVLDHQKDPAALQAILKEAGISYVYLGARGGALSPKVLRDSLWFELLHEENGTYVFRVQEGFGK